MDFRGCRLTAISQITQSAPPAVHVNLGSDEALAAAHAQLQQRFFPELVRNTELFTELFERSVRPALIRVGHACCPLRVILRMI